MKKSNIFNGMERTLQLLEDNIERFKEEYNSNLEELENYKNECKEIQTEPDKWTLNYKENNIESSLVTLSLFESAYNYIYENFHKITKEI